MSRVEKLYKVTKTHWCRTKNLQNEWSEWVISKKLVHYRTRIGDVKLAQNAVKQNDDFNKRWPDRAWQKYTVDVEYADMPAFKPYVP